MGFISEWPCFYNRYGKEFYYFFQNVERGTGAHSASYSFVSEFFLWQLNRARNKANLHVGQVRNEWSYNSTPPCAFIACTRKHLPLLWIRVIGNVVGLGFQLVVEKQFISYICRWNALFDMIRKIWRLATCGVII
jgi:hypothetical protein